MNLSRFLSGYEVVCQLLFLSLINFDIIFCCISMDLKTKEIIIPGSNQKVIPADETLDSRSDLDMIVQFRQYMSQNYNWKIKTSDLEFLWDKLKEFTKKGRKNRKPQVDQSKLSLPRKQRLTIEEVQSHYVNDKPNSKLIGVVKVNSGSKIVSRIIGFYDPEEYSKAMTYATTFLSNSCKYVNITFCLKKYLKEEHLYDGFQLLPPAIWIKRCPKKCSCFQENEDCLPTSTQNITRYVLMMNVNREQYTRPLVLDDHTGCACKDRCEDRRCISLFQLERYPSGDCKCVCIPGFEKKCTKLLEGYKKFSKSDYTCIVNGTCVSPDCRAGDLSEEDLYLRRCPKVLY